MLRQYEAVYIFDAGLEDTAINERLERHHALLGGPADMRIDHWGRRQLAYPAPSYGEDDGGAASDRAAPQGS